MELDKIYLDAFPKLNSNNHKKTSEADPTYNCIAWAVGCNTDFFSPEIYRYWPSNIKRECSIEAFLSLFNSYGYEICKNGELEKGFLKIALYTKNFIPKHAARQLSDGWWTSKLGTLADIKHKNLYDISGYDYGFPTHFFRHQFPSEF